MDENIDFKALRAKFHAQAERAVSSAGAYSRPHLTGPLPDASDNGLLRNKLLPAAPKPGLPVNQSTEPKRFTQSPQGVFPKAPPSYRVGAREDPKAPVNDSENARRVKLTGEILQNRMRQHLEKKPQAVPRPLLPSQRSISEVTPLRKPLPNAGQRPTKPKRPPSVNLDRFLGKAVVFQPTVHPDPKTPEGPPRPPKTAFLSATQSIPQRNIEPEQDTYDDIDLPPPPPPPPPPKPSSSESWTSSFSSQADEESDHSDIYEHIEDQEVITLPVASGKKKQKDKRQQDVEKKEQKEQMRKENEFRKKFKLTGEVEVIHTAWVREDWHGGKNDLRVRQGEAVEIVRVNDNPEGRWLARNMNGEYGYVSNMCVDVNYEEIKRKIRSEAPPFPLPAPEDDDVYDDVGADPLNSSLTDSAEVYDDIDQIPEHFPLPPPEICQDPKRTKKQEKEEKEFRKKFKFEGPIQVLCCMMVDPNANIRKASGKDLSVMKGEILEVIQQSNDKKVLCRNEQGKYGYVPRHYLLHEENEIYDDIDVTDVYDNDVSGSASASLRS